MLISDDHRFIFVHIPKTAGSSIQDVLEPYSRQPNDFWLTRWLRRAGVRSNPLAAPKYRSYRRHTTARKLQWFLPRGQFEQYFKFAFVRNPWDWLVSYYHYVMQKPDHRRYRQLRRLGSFDRFVEFQCVRPKFLQRDFVTSPAGEVIVDFVGRFESLAADFASVCRRLDLSVRLARRNRSRHGDYRSYYSTQSAELVADAYAGDIELFGYAFDGSRRKAA